MTTALQARADRALGRRLAEITLGVDALETSAADAAGVRSERFVPIFNGAGLVEPARFASFAEAIAALDALAAEVAVLPAGRRKTFLTAMVRSVRAAARIFAGESLSLAERLTEHVGVPAGPVPDETIASIHAELDRLMTKRGYVRGTLAERVERWEAETHVDVGDIPRVYDELLATAKARTDALVYDTGDYTMPLNAQRGVPYAARCSFDEGHMDINLDVPWSRSGIKHLVCHEVFPGHSTQLLSTRRAVETGKSAADALLCTVNGAPGSVQEGIGDQGIELIDWVESVDDAAHVQLRRLQTATGTSAAWHRNVTGWSHDRTVAYFREVGFGSEAWSELRTGRAEDPFDAPFLASYWFGSEAVRIVRERTPAAARGALLATLYDELNTPESLLMFEPQA